MRKTATVVMTLPFAGCATTSTDVALNDQRGDTSAISEIEQIEIVSSDEIVESGEQTVCRYVIPAGSRIARRHCYVYDSFEATVNDMINREVVEQMRESSLRRRRAELERMTGAGRADR